MPECQTRLRKIRALMAERGVQNLLVYSGHHIANCKERVNFRYLTNLPLWPHQEGIALIPSEDEPSLITSLTWDIHRVRTNTWLRNVQPSSSAYAIGQNDLLILLRNLRGNLGVDFESLGKLMLERLRKATPINHLLDAHGLVEEARMIKTRYELLLMTRAARIADKGMQIAKDLVAEGGLSETDVAIEVDHVMRQTGAVNFLSNTVIASGLSGEYPPLKASSKKIRSGEQVLVDVHPINEEGYVSDVARTYFCGLPKNGRVRFAKASYRACIEGTKCVRPGATLRDIVNSMTRVLRMSGVDKFIRHRMGHGLGMWLESPSFASDLDLQLQKGMILTLEPALYIHKIGGFSTENAIAVTTNGHTTLNKASYDPSVTS